MEKYLKGIKKEQSLFVLPANEKCLNYGVGCPVRRDKNCSVSNEDLSVTWSNIRIISLKTYRYK